MDDYKKKMIRWYTEVLARVIVIFALGFGIIMTINDVISHGFAAEQTALVILTAGAIYVIGHTSEMPRRPKNIKLFLDDERFPVDETFLIVRDSERFEFLLKAWGPEITEISFDHDLGENSQDGMWCLRYLTYCIVDHPHLDWKFEKFYLHSANPIGIDNFKKYIANAAEHVPQLKNVEVVDYSTTRTNGWVVKDPMLLTHQPA
jgi:hypothetical protein